LSNDMHWDGNSCPSSTPEEQGIHSRVFLNFFEDIRKEEIELHSIYIIRRNHMILSCVAKPFTMDTPHRIYSSAKGIHSLAAMFLVQEGKLSLDDKVVDIFRDYVPEDMDPRMKDMTVFDLLTMTNGHPRNGFYEMRQSDNWIKGFLRQKLLRQPGTLFEYNNGPPHLVCCIPRVLTGQNMIEYLTPRLFKPLGIFDLCQTCLDPAHPEDLEPTTQCLSPVGFVKFAQFFLQHGSWNGTQLLRADLCDMVGKRYFPTNHISDEKHGFGLFCTGCSFGGYRFSGGYGQQAIVIPELEMSCAYMANEDETTAQRILALFDQHIVQGCHQRSIAPLADDYQKLQALTANYSLGPNGTKNSVKQGAWNGKKVIFDMNPQGIDSVTFNLGDQIVLDIVRNGKSIRAKCGLNGEWEANDDFPLMNAASSLSPVIKGYEPAVILGYESGQPWLLSAAWTSENTLQINARRMDLMSMVTQVFTFAEKSASVRIHYHFLPDNNQKNPDVILAGPYA